MNDAATRRHGDAPKDPLSLWERVRVRGID
jgi:hypothetical protein